jgi:TfoX/Sxy family transcriptional regulator of competence genes
MPYDEQLADRVRDVLSTANNVTERKMFGGLAFLIAGNMACGIVGSDLMLRLGEDGADAALDQPHVRAMDFTGKPMSSMVYVEPAGITSRDALETWVGKAVEFAARLPAK